MEDIKNWESKFVACQYSDQLLNLLIFLNTILRIPVNIEVIKKACYYARIYHGDQTRKSGEPYYSHPLIVAYLFAAFVGYYKQRYCTTELIVIAILHDCLEDTKLTYEMIVEIFGKNVADGVMDLTRATDDGVKHAAFETLDSLYLQGKIGLLYVKLFDRLHNAMTLNFMSPTKQISIAAETFDHFTVYAKYYGLNELYEKLINICSLYLDDVKPHSPQLEALDPSCYQGDSPILSPAFQNKIAQMYNL
jgi:guanosine-3',5'-bis(diphosphate) 3'-pyrophosphohydrolase